MLELPARRSAKPSARIKDHDQAHNPIFPYLGEDRRVAMIHADLSGLGQMFQDAGNCAQSIKEMHEIAETIEKAIEAAAQAATKEVLIPAAKGDILPARPILLGGDDITILVRADLALRFCQKLLEEIEKETEKQFKEFGKTHPHFKRRAPLSACAGIVVANAGMPFLLTHALAEDLCKLAKKTAKGLLPDGRKATAPYASLLAFHNAQSTLQESYADIRAREMTARAKEAISL